MMTTMPEAVLALAIFTISLSWLRRHDKDETTERAHNLVQETLADSDLVRRIEEETGKNIRNQLTVEEMMELEEEIRLLKMRDGRN